MSGDGVDAGDGNLMDGGLMDEPLAPVIPIAKNGAPPPPPRPPPAPATDRRGRRSALVVAAVVAVAIAVVAAALVIVRRHDDGSTAAPGQAEATQFLAAWSGGDVQGMQRLVADADADVADDLHEVTAGLHVVSAVYAFDGMAPVAEGASDDRVTARYAATVQVGGLGGWTYHGTVPLKSTEQGYRVVWSRNVIHPDVGPTQKLDRVRQAPSRAPILAVDGRPLVQVRPSVTININPGGMKDQAALSQTLHDTLGVDPTTVDQALKQPWVKPDLLVPIVAVSRERYDAVKPVIYPVPGLRFTEGQSRLPLTDTFAKQLIGRTGEVTAEQLQRFGPTYQQGDVVGQSGLELANEKTLAGTPTGDIRLVDQQGAVLHNVGHIDGIAPAPLKTTLDISIQSAAESAVAGVTQPMALVALDSTGAVRAVVSRPVDDGFNRALAGQYPPGSTFKVVTAAALLDHGQTPASPVTCPPTVPVAGKVFHNFEGEQQGQLSLADAFASSCNTAFIGAAADLLGDQLTAAAGRFGFGAPIDLGVPAAGGTVPPPASDVERAATAIGQGGVLASPLLMAGVAATVQSGQWHPPVVVVDRPAPAGTAPPPAPLDDGVRRSLDELMHAVVARGTGTAAAVPGRDVAGKTGTAEFGTGNPPPTHAWFIGFTNQLSFAIVVEGGGVGGQVAAPIAATFLRNVA